MGVHYFALALLIAQTAPATAQNLSTEKLLNRWYESDLLCRGGAGDETLPWCKVRDGYVDLLVARDWCFGKKGQAEYQMEWHKCGPDSNKPDASLPKSAGAPQNPDQKPAEALEAAKRKIDCLLTEAQGIKVGKGCPQQLQGSAVGVEQKPEQAPEACEIEIEGCQKGEACRYDIVIEGPVAVRLYELMAKHGLQEELSGLLGIDTVTTNDGLTTCFREPSGYRCHFAYDVHNNKTTSVRICE